MVGGRQRGDHRVAGLDEIVAAGEVIYRHMGPTPEYCWPLICERAGTEVWVKHENHTPIGAFKLRGGLVYVDELLRREPDTPGVIAATRGNHGQSVAFAARGAGLRAVLVVPHGNSVEKNRAMRALGAELVEHGQDFNAAYDYAKELAAGRGLHLFPSYHPILVRGVATYGLELLRAVPDLDTLYVPIGLGSGISGVLAARQALGLKTRVVGVVAERAPTYALSFEAGQPVATDSCDTVADGVSVRVPDADALAIILTGVERVVAVSEDEIEAAMRAYFADTH
ncbi:MAG: threonine dehydratase, partial [Proteobacteria bacterium]|nr:threonine dehydratase [Pseudomonadota bacterium]